MLIIMGGACINYIVSVVCVNYNGWGIVFLRGRYV